MMNLRSPGLLISNAVPGFIQYKSAEGLSLRTLASYQYDLELWLEIRGDRDVKQVTTQELREYLNYVRTDYTPRRLNGDNNIKLSG
jgi:integrase/recombinase XerD